MAFMHGRDFVFAHKNEKGELVFSASVMPSLPLASVDDLFRDKTLTMEKTYVIASQGVYSYSSMNKTWFKCN